MFTLAISCLTTSNLPWFMDLTFQVPMQHCSLHYRTSLPSPVTSTIRRCFHFGSVSSFFLVLFLHSPLVAYWASTDLETSFSVVSFCLFILFMGFSRQEYWSSLPLPSPMFIITMFTIEKHSGNPWVFIDIKINNSVCLHHDQITSNGNEWAKTTCSNVNESYKHNIEKQLFTYLCILYNEKNAYWIMALWASPVAQW